MSNISPEMQSCIDECLRRYQTCLGMAMSHCLEAGGKHVAAGHLRTMMACAEMCHTLAHLMLIGTDHHKHTCAECAEICEACAKSCEQMGGIETCVQQCRRCADSCRKMAPAAHRPSRRGREAVGSPANGSSLRQAQRHVLTSA